MTPSDDSSTQVLATGVGIVSRYGVGGRQAAAEQRRVLLGGGAVDLDAGHGYPLEGFEAANYVGRRGLRHLTRGTLFLMTAAHLALRDASFDQANRPAREETGVVAGTLTDGVALVVDFDRRTLDATYVRQQERLATRGWRRLKEVAGQQSSIPIIDYPLPEVRAAWAARARDP